MLHIIKGDIGSGKTTFLARLAEKLISEKKNCFLIVPEQQTVSAERFMAQRLSPSFPLYFEITNFSRLANTIFRKYGGISYNYSSEATRSLIMWKTLGELLPFLHESHKEVEYGLVKRTLSALSELQAGAISAQKLDEAIDMADDNRLREKLQDLSKISTLYYSLLKEHYNDQGEDLDRLCELLEQHNFFDCSAVFVDSFTSFTMQEYKILSQIMKQCDLYITLALPQNSDERICFEEIENCEKKLLISATLNKIEFEILRLGESIRNPSPLLRYVAKNMTSSVCNSLPKHDGDREDDEKLRIIECPDPYAEAEFVALDIKRKVQNGAKYSDFSIFARDASLYEGILDNTLKKYDIPFFMSLRTDVSAFAPIRMIYAAYSVCISNFSQKDVITYLKCGLTGLSEKDCDDFEIYTKKWNINGRRFYDGLDWNMSPLGYVSQKNDDRISEFLIRINRTKNILIEPLEALYDFCKEKRSVSEHCHSLFSFMQKLSIEEKLFEMAEKAEKENDVQESENLKKLFSVICDSLDKLCDTLPDTVLGAEHFVQLLRIVFNETDIGQIPSFFDSVTVGSADMLRAESKHIYLFGVNAGEFPATVTDNSFFSQNDREILCELGLNLEQNLTEKASRELFCFYRAFCSATESVSLSYSNSGPSYAPQSPSYFIKNIKHLAGDHAKSVTYNSLNEIERLWNKSAAFEMLGNMENGNERQALIDIFSEDAEYARRLSGLKSPLITKNAKISESIIKDLYSSRINTTPSRIERYAKCSFSYFCTYIMKLNSHEDIKIDFLSIGNFVHAVLEMLFDYLSKDGKRISDLNEEETKAAVLSITSKYIRDITPKGSEQTPRMKHLFYRLYNAVLALVKNLQKEFSQSEFTPRFFEFKISENDKNSPSPISFETKNGTRISLYGTIDRVDTYKKDGNVYVRVVDYKTGSKEFSLESISYGLNMQMLIYLFSIWKTENEQFRKKLGCEDGEIIPTGVLYLSANVEDTKIDSFDENEIGKAVMGKYRRNGLLLNDENILRAMDKNLNSDFIPVKLTKKGELSPKKALASLDKMGKILEQIKDVLSNICSEMQSGNMDAVPLRAPKVNSPCQYCNLKPICRNKMAKSKR